MCAIAACRCLWQLCLLCLCRPCLLEAHLRRTSTSRGELAKLAKPGCRCGCRCGKKCMEPTTFLSGRCLPCSIEQPWEGVTELAAWVSKENVRGHGHAAGCLACFFLGSTIVTPSTLAISLSACSILCRCCRCGCQAADMISNFASCRSARWLKLAWVCVFPSSQQWLRRGLSKAKPKRISKS